MDVNDRFVGSEVIRESWMLTTALSLGAAVSKPNANVSTTHQSGHIDYKSKRQLN